MQTKSKTSTLKPKKQKPRRKKLNCSCLIIYPRFAALNSKLEKTEI